MKDQLISSQKALKLLVKAEAVANANKEKFLSQKDYSIAQQYSQQAVAYRDAMHLLTQLVRGEVAP